jgi:RNA polymerase sigma-70 factor (ECF subfamily)
MTTPADPRNLSHLAGASSPPAGASSPLARASRAGASNTARETDEGLVARLGARDEEALRTLHQRYAALVFTVAARLVDSATAEEVVQDVFLTLWKKHATFDPARGTFKSWVVQIARHRALNELRRGQRSQRDQPASGGEAVAQLADDAIEPDEAEWLEHRRTIIRRAVDALPPPQRQALSLAFFDELTHEQIAAVLQTPVGTTKTRIRLALKRLAPLLVIAVAGAFVAVVLRRQDDRAARTEDALRMVTASDVLPLRLAPAPGAPADAHGSYRARRGASVAVLTTSQLAPLTGPETYAAFARHGDAWERLGQVVVEADGRSVLVCATDPNAPTPDAIRVTKEGGASGANGPEGPLVLEWSGAALLPR